MRTIYIDCGMGAAGDMLTAALLELLPDAASFVEQFNHLGIPGVRMEREKTEKCGIQGTHVHIYVDGQEENEHEHSHGHEHTHHHASMRDIEHIFMSLPVSSKVREDALSVYRLIAEAESRAHGKPVNEIHFHEVGTMDAIADVTAVCMLFERLQADCVIVSPVHVGCGQVRCAHGILPVPTPATAYLLQGVPMYGGRIRGELCTPTGAALLKYFATAFGEMPVMQTEAVGYGMGTKDFTAANCVRALLGETADRDNEVVELCCNVDDMTAEDLGYALEMMFASGALEAYTVPVGMKKSRPGTLFHVICRVEDRDKMIRQIFRHTTTIGIRESISRRYILKRNTVKESTPYGEIRKKISEGYDVYREKYEYEDLSHIAREQQMSLEEVRKKIALAAQSDKEGKNR